MTQTSSLLASLTQTSLPVAQRHAALREFAQAFGWRPSDELLEYPGAEEYANGHLVVEHGLDNTAVITFLKGSHPFYVLDRPAKLRLLSISYNNLVDWQFFPDHDGLTAVYNRVDPLAPRRLSTYEDTDIWHAVSFERITGGAPSPNLKSLDAALIETISFWKRSIAAELRHTVPIETFSALFNAILFVRALEDHQRVKSPSARRLLIETWNREETRTIRDCIVRCLETLGVTELPADLINLELLRACDPLDPLMVGQLLRDFYDNRFAPYQYDFSLMSKHALSRIYEKYVTLLKEPDSAQLTFFPDLPEEISPQALGGVYTPQYIARFFGRFLQDNVSPRSFRTMRIADPSCGSGIFLRTVLEMKCDPFRNGLADQGSIQDAFANVLGIDWDLNAVHATRLSLSLLHLVLAEALPTQLRIEHAEAIAYFEQHQDLQGSIDAVIANPPFIKWDRLRPELRNTVAAFMADYNLGKVDMFLAHFQLGVKMVRPGGFLLYVLPHSFLIGRNAASLRSELSKTFWIRCLVDLSEIPVFEHVGSYVILLILERKAEYANDVPRALIVRCREFVGHALQDALEGKVVANDFYEIYEVDQGRFADAKWDIVRPTHLTIQDKVRRLRPLDDFLIIRQGIVTGADDVFIIDAKRMPPGEKAIYAPFLSDREMQRYAVPKATAKVIFYPFHEGERISEERLRDSFPETWKYLESNVARLSQRSSVRHGSVAWWSPERPRTPNTVFRPKIVSPHLVLLPRFSIDVKGEYAVSRCPLMYPKGEGADVDLLEFFLSVLNSPISLWQIAQLSHKYSRGYAMLEPKTLKEMRVPDPSIISSAGIARILDLVKKRLVEASDEVEREIDRLVADMYGLSASERRLAGMEE